MSVLYESCCYTVIQIHLRIPTSLIFFKELALNSIFFREIYIIFYLSGNVRRCLLSVNVIAYFMSYCSYVIVVIKIPECHHTVC